MNETPDEIREAARAAEREGRAADALAMVDRGIVAYPNRADFHAMRARLLVTTGGALASAAQHAARAAQLEPGNTSYGDMARDYAARAGLPAPDLSRPPAPPAAVPAETSAAPPPARRSGGGFAMPRSPKEWGLAGAGIAVVLALAGWNVFYWVVRPAAGHPRQLDVAGASKIVPLTGLQLLGDTAYGTVGPGWNALPDREKKVSALAGTLASAGAREVVLSDGENHLVARGTGSSATVFAKSTP